MKIKKEKWLRLYLMVVGVWSILNGTFGVLSYGVSLVFGYLTFEPVELLGASGWLFALIFGIGILRLKNWARLGMAALVSVKLVSMAVFFFAMRNLAFDAYGVSLLLAALAVHLLAVFLLIKASVVTRDGCLKPSRRWLIGGVVAACIGAGGYALGLVDVSAFDARELPASANGELSFLKSGATWRLEKLALGKSQNGSVKMSSYDKGLFSIRERKGLLAIEGLPTLKNIAVRIDPNSNVLFLNDSIFIGEPFKTDRFLWQDLSVEGVEFTNGAGPLSGKVIVARTPDGVIYIALQLDIYFRDVEAFYRAVPQS